MDGRMVKWMKWALGVVLLCTATSCEELMEVKGTSGNDPEMVEVTVRLGFATEENAGDGRTATTRANEITTPDALYELHVLQFDQGGTQLDANGSESNKRFYSSSVNVGAALTFSLTPSDDCRLVIIARGKGISSPGINDGSFSALQSISFNRSVINTIPTSGATQDEMNKMPYVLYLKHVKVTSDGKLQSPDIESPDGSQDVRLLLKRLAAKVTVNWQYNVTVGGEHYTLKQLLLQDVPLNFKYLPKPDADGVYPDIVDQYTTLEVSGYDVSAHQTDGTYSFWVPANVRKDNPAITSAPLRIKANASEGSSYLTFVAVSDKDAKRKFSYRVYLGDDDPANFSIKSNTDYIYDMKFTHTSVSTGDRRMTYIDPIPASENNDNLVPTANCFMVAPGGAFCFDPFAYSQNGNDNGNNTELQSWATSEGGIAYVKVLWQTRENGDTGEPVLGVVNQYAPANLSKDDHTNIVDVKRNDGTDVASSPLTAKGQGRIYCRVASNTVGGNGVIAAYNSSNVILWSWHVWVTDYKPDATGNATVLEPANKRKLKYTYNVPSGGQLPMMDRTLGATAGYVNDYPKKPLDKSRTNGLQYQWGRKDPFTGSFSTEPISNIPNTGGNTPVKGMLNRYGPDGMSYVPIETVSNGQSYRNIYKTPHKKGVGSGRNWCNNMSGSFWTTLKTVFDPCPAGWKVPERSAFATFIAEDGYTNSGKVAKTPNILYPTSYSDLQKEYGGILGYYDGKNSGNYVYMRFTGYTGGTDYINIGLFFSYWNTTASSPFIGKIDTNATKWEYFYIGTDWYQFDAHSVRCIQENE